MWRRINQLHFWPDLVVIFLAFTLGRVLGEILYALLIQGWWRETLDGWFS